MIAMYTVVADDLEVTRQIVKDDEIPAMLDSGFVSAVLRLNNDVIEYACVDWREWSVVWKTPAIDKEDNPSRSEDE